MKDRLFRRTCMVLMLLIAVIATGGLMIGCAGSDGSAGANGANGTNGTDGTDLTAAPSNEQCLLCHGSGQLAAINAMHGTTVTTEPVIAFNGIVDIANQSPASLAGLKMTISGPTTSVSAPLFTMSNQPVVTFKVTDQLGRPVIGLGLKSSTTNTWQLNYMRFGLAKLVNAGTNTERWQGYIIQPLGRGVTTLPITPTAERNGDIVDNGDGTYVYTFATPVVSGNTNTWAPAYDAAATTRFAIQLSGAGPNFVNYTYDFIPAGGAPISRNVVHVSACKKCHDTNFAFHGSRQDPKYCVVCHTDQRGNGAVASTPSSTGLFTDSTQTIVNGMDQLELVTFIHKIHRGEELALKNYKVGGVKLNEVTYPQDIRNCDMCHNASASEASNWNTRPSRKACGSCHDNVSWDAVVPTGFVAHSNGSKTDAQCALCHDATDIQAMHVAIAPPDPNNIYLVPGTGNNNTNASCLAAAGAVPAGADVITYVLSSVTTSNNHPSITFALKSSVSGTVVFSAPSSTAPLMTGFAGSPSVYFAWAVPQDGITAPVDFNATASGYIKNINNGTATGTGAGTLTGPDASGYYTIVLTGVTVPSSATMLTGGVGYTYGLSTTQPLTQISGFTVPSYLTTACTYSTGNKVGGLSVPAPNLWKVATGYTARRTIVDTAKCNACHVALGAVPTFHAGQRNDAPTCSFCHTTNRVNSGWSVNAKDSIHAIHAAGKRVNAFTWEAAAGSRFQDVTYPGVLNDCLQCHVAGMFDFSNSTYTSALIDRMLFSTAATGSYSATNTPYPSPFVSYGVDYGTGFSFNAGTGVTTAASGSTLVISPISAACSACHDTDTARAHMKANGGAIYQQRSIAIP